MNFRLTARLAAEVGADIALRIDDVDAARYRREYVQDIFRVLRDLRIEWQRGPRDVEDFEAAYSQRRRTEYYRSQLGRLRDGGVQTYACTCSRTMVRGVATDGCPGACRTAGIALAPGVSALRVHVPRGTEVDVNGAVVRLDEAMGDFVVWRRDDLPAYQLVSLIEDRDLGTTLVVRGQDLLESTAAQIFLAPALGAAAFGRARFVHHALITDESGAKLSKSRGPATPRR